MGKVWSRQVIGSDRQKLIGKIFAVVNASVHTDKALQRGLVLHVRVVQTGVQHDDGKGEDVTSV